MESWELDIYRSLIIGDDQKPLGELLVCTSEGQSLLNKFCSAAQVNAAWLQTQLQNLIEERGETPLEIRVFRSASFNLSQPACQALFIPLRKSLRAIAIQRWLAYRQQNIYPSLEGYSPSQRVHPVQRPVPVAFPEELLPERWGFSALPAAELSLLRQVSISYGDIPFWKEDWRDWPSAAVIPGLFLIRKEAKPLVRWLEEKGPVALSYVEAESSAILLETDTEERWILATFEDAEMKASARQFIERMDQLQGLHFIAVQASEEDEAITGFWLLQAQ
ncbi:MAG: Tab2 family RNA-binding protein [Gloeobacterales cyanobacterium]